MKTLKLLIKTSFFNTVNDFLCFDIIKYIFNRRSNKVPQPGISEHCETMDRAGVSRDMPDYFPSFHSSITTEGGLRLSRPGCLVMH